MKQFFFAIVSLIVVSFLATSTANAQLGGNTGGTGGGLSGLTGTGGTGGTSTGGVATVGGTPLGGSATGSSTPAGPEFGGGQIAINTQPLDDTRSTSINQGTAGGGGANAGGGNFGAGGNNALQSLFQGLTGGQGQFGSPGGGQVQNQPRLVRGALRVGFEFTATSAKVTPQQMAAVSTTTFARLPKFSNTNIRVVADGQTLVLTGTVKTQSERMLAERVAKLEPGVSKVDNQIEVVSN